MNEMVLEKAVKCNLRQEKRPEAREKPAPTPIRLPRFSQVVGLQGGMGGSTGDVGEATPEGLENEL